MVTINMSYTDLQSASLTYFDPFPPCRWIRLNIFAPPGAQEFHRLGWPVDGSGSLDIWDASRLVQTEWWPYRTLRLSNIIKHIPRSGRWEHWSRFEDKKCIRTKIAMKHTNAYSNSRCYIQYVVHSQFWQPQVLTDLSEPSSQFVE